MHIHIYKGGFAMDYHYSYKYVGRGRYERLKKKSKILLCLTVVASLLVVAFAISNYNMKKEVNELKSEHEKLLSMYEAMSVEYSNYVTRAEKQKKEQRSNVTPYLFGGAEEFSSVPLTTDVIQYIYNASIANDYKPEILFSLIEEESRFDSHAVSGTGDHGLFQINRTNFEDIAKHFNLSMDEFMERLYDPEFSCDCAIYIMNNIRDNYHIDNYHILLMYYNMGPSNAQKCFNSGCYSSRYTRDIVNLAINKWGLESYEL